MNQNCYLCLCFRTLVLFISFLFVFNSQAQVFEWLRGGEGTQSATTIVGDSEGNLYVGGHFQFFMDASFGDDPHILSSAGEELNAYFSKYDNEGNLIWAKNLVAFEETPGYSYTNEILVRETGDVYIVGHYKGTVDFDPGPSEHILVTDDSFTNAFILKVNADGDFQWVIDLGGVSFEDINEIIEDSDGNIIVGGSFGSEMDFDPGPGVEMRSPFGGTLNGFILKLTPEGEFIWVKILFSDFGSSVLDIGIDEDGALYVAGHFRGFIDVDPTPYAYVLNGEEEVQSVFIAKYDEDEEILWGKNINGNDLIYLFGLEIEDGEVYLTGTYSNAVDFDPGADVFEMIGNPDFGDHSCFVERLNTDGEFVWAKSLSGSGFITSKDIKIDTEGNLFLVGFFGRGTIDFDPGEGSVLHSSPDDGMSYDFFVQKMNIEGDFLWVGVSNAVGIENIRDFTIDEVGSLYMFGNSTISMADHDFGEGVEILESGSNCFLWKLEACSAVEGVDEIVACNSFQPPSGGHPYTESGIYSDTLRSIFGCDSVVTLNVTILDVDFSVVEEELTLTAYPDGAIYQWLKCLEGDTFEEIDGATDQTFIAEESGSYAVITVTDDCVDTSDCILLIDDVGLNAVAGQIRYNIYPNPSNGELTISTATDEKVLIYNLLGEKLFQTNVVKGQNNLNFSHWEKGVYAIVISSNEERQTKMLVLE